MTVTKRFCPNCDRPVAIHTGGTEADDRADCEPCGMTWFGWRLIGQLPRSPIGSEARNKAWEHAWDQAKS